MYQWHDNHSKGKTLSINSAESQIPATAIAFPALLWTSLSEAHSLATPRPSVPWLQNVFSFCLAPCSVGVTKHSVLLQAGSGSCASGVTLAGSWACLCRAGTGVGVPVQAPCREGNLSACIQTEKPPWRKRLRHKTRWACFSAEPAAALLTGTRKALKWNRETKEICSFDSFSLRILQAPDGCGPKQKISPCDPV